jgi:alpha-L-fucosidase
MNLRPFLLLPLALCGLGAGEPAPHLPVPSPRQLAWHRLEAYAFVHFTTNTFTDREWGLGDEPEAIFAPTDFDADQIVAAVKEAGLKGLILTCKHHDGFCLWPSRLTEHSVKRSPWKGGRGDVVREVSRACQRQGVAFGIYLSPWDRNRPDYGQPSYVDYWQGQLRELLSGYGPLFEVWFDGANGGDGWYGGARGTRKIDPATYYRWPGTFALVRSLQPGAAIFSDMGPDVRWVGNEEGAAGDPCWATIDGQDWAPGRVPAAELGGGKRDGHRWVPAETDVSIRPGWFWHAREDSQVRSGDDLFNLWFTSVGRGSSLILNLPPDRRGRIPDPDLASLRAFRRRMDAVFTTDLARQARAEGPARDGDAARFGPANLVDGNPDTYWATDDGAALPRVELRFPAPVTFDIIRLRERLPLGQRVDAWSVEAWRDGAWHPFAQGTSIGACRLARGERTTSDRIRLTILKGAACPCITEFGVFRDVPGAPAPDQKARHGSE